MSEKLSYAEQKIVNSYKKRQSQYNSLGLKPTFRSVQYLLDIEHISIAQLKTCTFLDENGNEYFDQNKAAILCIKAGLIGAGRETLENEDKLEEHTYKIVEQWTKHDGLIVLHKLFIEDMEDRHFFLSSADLKIIQQKVSTKLQKNLVELAISQVLRYQKQIITLFGTNNS